MGNVIDSEIEKQSQIIRDLIDQGELLREKGKIISAQISFEIAIERAEDHGLMLLNAEAIQQLVICYKHRWQNSGTDRYLDWMMQTIEKGFALKVPDTSKAGFYLRRADVRAAREQLGEAFGDYQLAYDLVEKGGHSQAEFLGHLAEYQAKLGAPKPAFRNIAEAISMMWKIKTPNKPWRKWVILSGMYGRKAVVQKIFSWRLRAKVSEGIGYLMAWWLLLRYGMGQRLKQAHLMCLEKNV